KAGLTREETARKARLQSGGLGQAKEDRRDARVVTWIEDFVRDLDHGLRIMRQNVGFSAAAVLTIGIAIGVNTAIFSTDEAVLFRVLPYKDPARLMQVFQKYLPRPTVDRMPVAPANYLDWKTGSKSFESLSAYRLANLNLGGNDNPERVRAAQVTINTFATLGVAPVIGRDFHTGEDAAGANSVVVLSYGLWQRRFAGHKGIIGKSIRANDQPYVVIGVMPPGFRFPIGWISSDIEIWTPLILDGAQQASRKDIILDVIARLRPGVSVQQAQADLDLV